MSRFCPPGCLRALAIALGSAPNKNRTQSAGKVARAERLRARSIKQALRAGRWTAQGVAMKM
jgi:hypothetical protein